MDTSKEYSSTAGAARDFFGNYPSAQAFMQDWKQLTDSDKAEIRAGLEQNGYRFSSKESAAS